MRILKYGSMERYECGRCGCEFEAGRNESRIDTCGRRVCWCPCCGNTVPAVGPVKDKEDAEDDDDLIFFADGEEIRQEEAEGTGGGA